MLNVTITAEHGGASGLRVPAEIISDTSGDVVKEVGLDVGGTTPVDVQPGEYTVRARFPSGRFMAAQSKGRDDVSIAVPPSAHEFLEYQTATGAAPALDRFAPLRTAQPTNRGCSCGAPSLCRGLQAVRTPTARPGS